MINYWRTYCVVRKARRLERQLDALPPSPGLSRRPELIQVAQSLKQSFLSNLESGSIDAVARLYGRSLKKKALPSLQAKHSKTRISSELAVECLTELKKLFVQTRVRAFLMSGTFLGCVREQRILAHDYDLDIGVNLSDAGLPGLLAALEKHPDFHIESKIQITNEVAMMNDWASGQAGKPWLLKVLFKGTIHADFFVHISHQGESFHGSLSNLWVNSDFSLAPRAFYGLEFDAPENAEAYLAENYGDWRTPAKQFCCATDTPNSRALHALNALRHLIKQHILRGWLGDARRQAILIERIHQTFEVGDGGRRAEVRQAWAAASSTQLNSH